MSINSLKNHGLESTEARLREEAVAKALFEQITAEAVNKINGMSQSELKQWEQALKDRKAPQARTALLPSLGLQ
jgi:hypothetical protein